MFSISKLALVALVSGATVMSAASIRVTITNQAPANGTFLTPVWVGFHNGTFDTYNPGSPISPALERLAEDGDTGAITGLFAGSGAGTIQGTLGGAPIAPGASVSMTFQLDASAPSNRYFSYASMIIPSNDLFISNGNPLAFELFDAMGNFTPVNRNVMGTMVNDAGSEVNDEIPENTAFFGQMAPDTGVVEVNGVVMPSTGFIPGGAILSSAMFANANFLANGFIVANISIEEVPEPSTWGLIAVSLTGLAGLARRRQRIGL